MARTDVSEIPSEVIRTALHETVETKLKSKKCQIELSLASQAGSNNFIGIVYRASFCREQDENENETNSMHQMIVKVAPQHVVRRDLFITRPTFLREIYMYETVSNRQKEYVNFH